MGKVYRPNKSMSANYDITKVGPFDVREVVSLKSDLTGATFGYNFYAGMKVSVVEDTAENNGLYLCMDASTESGTWVKLQTENDKSGIAIQVLGVLPEVGEENTLYYINSSSQGDNNLYAEYMWINDRWEKLGESIDLSGFYNKDEVDAKTTELNNNINTVSGKVNEVTDKVNGIVNESGTIKASVLPGWETI